MDLSIRGSKLLNVKENPDQVFEIFKDRGLMPAKFKNKEALFSGIMKLMNSGDGSMSLGAAIKKLTGLSNAELGIPLDYNKEGSSSKGDRNVTEVFFDARGFNERVPLKVQDWFREGEENGTIPKGSLEKFIKYIKQGNAGNDKLRKQLQRLTGIKWEKGHLLSLGSGASHDPDSQVPELRSENRSHNVRNLISEEDMQALGLPIDWWGSATDFVLIQKGNKQGSGLQRGDLTPGDKASVTRHGLDPNKVTAARRQAIEKQLLERALSEFNTAKAGGTSNEFLAKINSRIDEDGNYIQPNNLFKGPNFTSPFNKPKQEVQTIIPHPSKAEIKKMEGLGMEWNQQVGRFTPKYDQSSHLMKDAILANRFSIGPDFFNKAHSALQTVGNTLGGPFQKVVTADKLIHSAVEGDTINTAVNAFKTLTHTEDLPLEDSTNITAGY